MAADEVNRSETSSILPAYGFMTEFHMARIAGPHVIPADFDAPDLPGSTQEEKWRYFTTQLLKLINDVIWPRFEPKAPPASQWQGQSAAFMLELTDTDIKLLQQILAAPMVLDQPVHSLPREFPTHRDFFENEDEAKVPPGPDHFIYDPTLPRRLTDRMPQLFIDGLKAKCGNELLRIKLILQRPRPYQAAFLRGFTGFKYLQAKSADTPSICSGHSLQGLMATGAIIERFILDGETLDAKQWAAIEQYGVDIGDRRVMAGIHYPSDNICSWLITMLQANRVFRNTEVKVKLWEAISRQSLLYKRIDSCIKAGDGKEFETSWQTLHDAADGKITI